MSKAPPRSAFQRSASLFKMVGSLASKEVASRLSGDDSPLVRLKQAQTLVKELGHLKGAAMKLGQMLALEARDYLPDEVCQVLEQLQSEASFMDFSVIDSILAQELDEKKKEFSFISEIPLAAASIGQVHRARLFDRDVVLKVQYPGIQESIHSDIKVLGQVLKAVAVLMRKQVDLDGIIGEFGEIFSQETDYLQEAEFLREYREKAQVLSSVVIPEVLLNYSSSRVLCMSYESGVTLPQLMRSSNEDLELRKYFGHLILDIYTREFCDWGLVQTDPNLGNFLLRPEARELVLLDFGATKTYDLEFRVQYSKLIVAVLSRDEAAVLRIAIEMKLIDPRESAAAQKVFCALMFESIHPITLPEYDFSDASYVRNMQRLSKELVGALKFSPPPKNLIFLHRKLGGIFHMLRILKVRLDLRRYTERFETLAGSSLG